MDPITLIVAALAAGASAGTLDALRDDAGAADDADLVEAARALMELADAAGTAAGKYNVTIMDSRGVQVGDHNIQVNRFGG